MFINLSLQTTSIEIRTLIFGFGKTQKYEDAADAFVKAGNAYKLANLWQSAGPIVFMEKLLC